MRGEERRREEMRVRDRQARARDRPQLVEGVRLARRLLEPAMVIPLTILTLVMVTWVMWMWSLMIQ